MIDAFLVAFGVVFVAELGDKSQLMALAFATRYRPLPILVGITIATALVQAIAVSVGAVLGARLPTNLITIIAGVAFIGFAVWNLRGEELDEEDEARVEHAGHGAIVAASATFFLSEIGDKTMLATIALAATSGWLGTWAGATAGMVAADALAILVGAQVGKRLPERAIRIGSTIAFLVLGVILILEGALG